MASSPTPWTIRPHLPDAHFEVVADAEGNTVGTATRPDDAALIVEAVNEHIARHRMIDVETLDHVASERDRLRDIVRQSVETLEQVLKHADMTVYLREVVVDAQREAREALGEGEP